MKKWLQRLYRKEHITGTILQQAEAARAEEELKILHTDFSAAWQFFKENYRNNYNLPLYLIIGQSSFGKTTLLAKSGLDLQDVHGNKVQNNFSTKYCVWLFSPQATFLDTAGVYSTSDKDNPHANLVWLGFLRFLQGRFWHNPISGIVVVIDIPTLLGGKDTLQKVLNDAKERLYEIAQYVDTLPVYVVFTKLDVLSGFSDFFADLSLEERKQPFGITFAQEDKYINPQHALATSFTLLLSRLQEKLKLRLQKEEDIAVRLRAQEFFGQFSTLNDAIGLVFNELPYGGHIVLHGCYFVSGLQDDSSNSIDNIMDDLTQALQGSKLAQNQPFTSTKNDSKTYFVEGLFTQVMLENRIGRNVKSHNISWKQIIFTSVLAVCLGMASFAWYNSYTKNTDVFVEVVKVLQDKTQPGAAKLEQAISIANVNTSFWWAHIGFSHMQKLKTSLAKIYYQKLAADFTAQLQKTLEEELTLASTTDYKYLYDTLKTYIMLGDASKMDVDYVSNWFEKYWQKKYADNSAKAQHLTTQLAIILPQGIQIKSATQMITTARQMLNSHNVPKEDLVYAVLEKQYENQNLSFKFDGKEINISKLYTADNLAKIYNKQIPQMAYALSRKDGDWVLAGAGEEQLNIPRGDMDRLIANLRTLYVKHYVDAWDSASQQIRISSFNDIKKMQHLLVDINSSDYPLLSFLKIMQLNLSVNDAPLELRKMVDERLGGVAGADIKSIYEAVNELSTYLSKITSSPNINKTAFDLAAAKFRNGENNKDALDNLQAIADRQPKLIKDWLQSLSNSSWLSILASAQVYINTMWAANVLPEYDRIINNTYPFFKKANKSIAISDLAKFFALNGVMDSFFNSYLRPFVDTDQVYWTWKNVNGQTLGIGQDKLELFIRSALIRKMFYPNGGNVPDVKFSLIAQGLTPHTQRFSLNLGGQVISYAKGQKMVDNLVWPGPTPDLVSIGFINSLGATVDSAMPRDVWGWFRLLDKANFKTIDGTQRFNFTIDLNGNAVKYEMDVAQPINPFIPGVIDSFRCPDKL